MSFFYSEYADVLRPIRERLKIKKTPGDYVTHPLITVHPVFLNVFLSNRSAAERIVQNKSIDVYIINASGLELRGAQYDAPIDDSASVSVNEYYFFLNAVSEEVEKARRSHDFVLVNCYAGVDRSSAIVIKWLMRYHGFKYSDAFVRVWQVKKLSAKEFGAYNEKGQIDWPTLTTNSETGARNLIKACT